MNRIASIIGLFIGATLLFSLGLWQVERGKWKKELLATLEREYNKEAQNTPLLAHDFDFNENDRYKIIRGTISGHFINAPPLLFVRSGYASFEPFFPFLTDTQHILLVSRGTLQGSIEHASSFLKPYPLGTNEDITLTGLLRRPQSNSFTPQNKPRDNKWFRFEENEIKAFLNVKTPIVPAVFYLEKSSKDNIKPFDTQKDVHLGIRLSPPDNHGQYALFWFTMCALWCGVIGWRITMR